MNKSLGRYIIIFTLLIAVILTGQTEALAYGNRGVSLPKTLPESPMKNDINKIFKNSDDVVVKVREGLKSHSQKITVSFAYKDNILDEMTDLCDSWMEQAFEETGKADEGDYIRYQCGGYETKCRYERRDGRYFYTVDIIPKYYMYISQEEEVSKKISEIIEGLSFDEKTSDFEKASAIYDYICKNVIYDRSHRKRKQYYLRSTSWAALIKGTATCQGYAVTLYRMLKEVGIDSRVITGQALTDSLHAWNIINIDGKYYLADATWDSGNEEYEFFLRGEKNFKDHVADEEIFDDDFKKSYKTEQEDYGV